MILGSDFFWGDVNFGGNNYWTDWHILSFVKPIWLGRVDHFAVREFYALIPYVLVVTKFENKSLILEYPSKKSRYVFHFVDECILGIKCSDHSLHFPMVLTSG